MVRYIYTGRDFRALAPRRRSATILAVRAVTIKINKLYSTQRNKRVIIILREKLCI